MSKHQVQFQKGFSLVDFMGQYGTEAQCADALFKARWPSGFRCPACGGDRHSLVKTRDLLPRLGLPPPSLADRRAAVRADQAAAHHVVFGHPLVHL